MNHARDVSPASARAGQIDETEAAGRRAILLITSDALLAGLVGHALDCQGYSVSYESLADRAVDRCKDDDYCLVVADAAVDGVTFPDLVRGIRRHCGIPLIVIAADWEPRDEVRLLESGADDFVGRPTSCDALIARIRAVLRRVSLSRGRGVDAGTIQFDPRARLVFADSRPVDCTSVEYDILEHLSRQAGKVVSREQLVLEVFGRETTPFDRALDVHISHLRRKLRHAGRRIVTVRGVGYMLASS